MSVPAVEIFTTEEPDRRICEAEELSLTGLSRVTRWKYAKEGRYPPKGSLGPWLSEVLLFCSDPENYQFGESVVSDDADRDDVPVRNVRRRAVRSR